VGEGEGGEGEGEGGEGEGEGGEGEGEGGEGEGEGQPYACSGTDGWYPLAVEDFIVPTTVSPWAWNDSTYGVPTADFWTGDLKNGLQFGGCFIWYTLSSPCIVVGAYVTPADDLSTPVSRPLLCPDPGTVGQHFIAFYCYQDRRGGARAADLLLPEGEYTFVLSLQDEYGDYRGYCKNFAVQY